MSKYFRGDIWFANLQRLGIKNHYVVIVSDWKNNIKSNNVIVLLITSKNKPTDRTNVNIEMTVESKILADNIHTIDKKELVRKVGKLDTKTLLELDLKLKSCLELQDKSYNVNPTELEDLFMNSISKDKEQQKLELQDLKVLLWNQYKEKNYIDSITTANILEDKALKSKLINKHEYVFYASYMRALNYIKQKDFINALPDAQRALTCVGNPTELNDNYSITMWAIARCYEELGNKEKAIEIYKILSKYYRGIDDYNMRICCIFNHAKLKNNIRIMELIYSILKKSNPSNQTVYNTKERTKMLLKDMKDEINDLKNRL